MNDLHRIFLVEQTPEALEAVNSGNAKISTGGIRRNDGTLLEASKPVEMSAEDLLSAYETKEEAAAIEEKLKAFDNRLNLSAETVGKLDKSAWLNSKALQQNYILTFEGFQKTIAGIDRLSEQLSDIDSFIRKRDAEKRFDTARTYFLNLKTAASNLRASDYDVTNSYIPTQLNEIATFLDRLYCDAKQKDGDGYASMQMLASLIQPFIYVVRKYSALYFYKNGFYPGNYDEWMKVAERIIVPDNLHDLIEYYMRVYFPLPYKESIQIRMLRSRSYVNALSTAKFEKKFVSTHRKEEYLTLERQISKKIETGDTKTINGDMIIFVP